MRTPRPSRYFVNYANREAFARELERNHGIVECTDPALYWKEREFDDLQEARRFLHSEEAALEGAHLYERKNFEWEYGWDWDEELIEES